MTAGRHRPAPVPGALPPPRKRFGQHFLRDAGALGAIVEALGPIDDRTVVEVGPGRGALTDRLAERAGRLVAIELDRDLAHHLRDRYADRPTVTVVEADVLTVPLAEVAGPGYVLVGNVPYYITTPILFHAMAPPRPDRAVFLVQREVAERLTAAPGSRAYGALTVNVAVVATVEVLRHVPPGAFRPPPAVDSAVVRLVPRAEPLVAAGEERAFRQLVQAAFGLRRKQLHRVVRTVASLSPARAQAVLDRAGLPGAIRPEALAPEAFVRLATAIRAEVAGAARVAASA
jgi:16S rRNA (adenine1518-N6/adenine1519-N6)-dimethyltransferase